jgi:uncharacterized protein
MVKRTKEITPVKAVLIYSIALVLVVFSELPRVLSWMEETRCKLFAGQMFDSFGANQLKLVSMTSDPAEDRVQTRNDLSRQADPEGTQEAGPVTSGCPAAQGDDQQGGPPDSSMPGNVENPVAQSERQTNGQGSSVSATSSLKLKPHKVLLVGDSMIAEGFGPALQRRLSKNTSLKVIRKGQYSTGFVHQEDFNWASALRELIQKNEPDMIVIHMGTNDPIDILDDSGKRLYFGNDKWNEVYASRVGEFLKFASEKKILSFWVGLPIMSSNKYCAKINLINSIVERECAKVSGCVYVDCWSALADSNGNYSTFIKSPGGRQTRIRAKDNVHLTETGGQMLSEYFLRAASEYVDICADDEDTAPR